MITPASTELRLTLFEPPPPPDADISIVSLDVFAVKVIFVPATKVNASDVASASMFVPPIVILENAFCSGLIQA